MVTERVITLPTEPTEGEIMKSHPLFSFINIGQRSRKRNIIFIALQVYKLDVWCRPVNIPSLRWSNYSKHSNDGTQWGVGTD